MLVDLLLGQIIGIFPPSSRLIDFLSLRIAKPSFLVCPK
jgi:hypothetical protein